MTNEHIKSRIGELLQTERNLDVELIDLIARAEERRLYAEDGKESMFEWLTKHFGFSESSAQRRITAARLVKVLPDITEKLESGELSLSAVCEIQSAVTKTERATKTKLSREKKEVLVQKAQGKSIQQTREMLAAEFPELPPPEKARPINESQITVSFTLTKEQYDLYLQAKAAYSNTDPKADMATIVTEGFKAFLTAAAKKQSVKHREVRKRANHQCQWETQGQRCGSKHQLEIDHILPRAKGGTNDPANLRVLCRPHNQLAAEQHFGRHRVRRHHP